MKEERVEFRASHDERQRIERAAASVGMNISAFLRMIALQKSDEIIRSATNLTLTSRDWDMFMDLLENPPKINRRLKAAISKYNKLTSQ